MAVIPDGLLLRAATIDELLSDQFEAETVQTADLELAAQRLAVWCRASANGDWAMFAHRLSRDGLSFEDVLPRLGRVHLRSGLPPPLWASDAAWVLEQLASHSVDGDPIERLLLSKPAPFHDVFVPLFSGALEKLLRELTSELRATCCTTVELLLGHLVDRLCELAAPALYDDFLRFKQNFPTDLKGPAVAYEAYLAHLRMGALPALFDRLPVLLRLLAVTYRQWHEVSLEFLNRLSNDLAIIRRDLVPNFDISDIVDIDANVSDLHNDGRAVCIITTNSGYRLVYKPKSLDLDEFLWQFLNELGKNSPPIDLRVAKSLPRGDYGWSEFVPFLPCAKKEDVTRFYERAGAWLVLFHLLAATDMHEENIIANGGYPVPIDLEMLFQVAEDPSRIVIPETHAIELAGQKIAESLIMTGMLPDYIKTLDNRVVDRGGFNVGVGENTRLLWENLNTDQMRPRRVPARRLATNNVPELAGRKVGLGDHLPDLERGFKTYAQFLSTNRDFLTELFQRASGLPTRAIERPTRFYGLLLERLRNPRNMGDGATWSANADFVSRVTDMEGSADPLWLLLCSERNALCGLNIPYFTARTDSTEVADRSGVLADGEVIPGLAHALQRVKNFDQLEVEWQSTVLRLSTSTIGSRLNSLGNIELSDGATPTELKKGILLSEARAIFEHINTSAIRSGPGVAWIGLDWLGDSDFCRLVALGPDLYNGNPGVALFLAAYAKTFGSVEAEELAFAAVSALRHNLKSPNSQRYARALGLGGGTGLGGVIYALTAVGLLCEEEELLVDATAAARLITTNLISSDRQLDVLGGAAGAALALLRLFRATSDPFILKLATACGDHALNEVAIRQCDLGRPFMNGMAHGGAGFALAFGRLGVATGLSRFIEAAKECIDRENRTFSSMHGNWPTLTESGAVEQSWPCQWCHGAGGIGLARIGLLKGAVDLERDLRSDVARAVGAARIAWPYPLDTVCCGTAGNIELLAEASAVLNESELRMMSDLRLAHAIQSAAARGDYLWNVGDRRFSLGLFRGISGVGYTILRSINRKLPNYLIWE